MPIFGYNLSFNEYLLLSTLLSVIVNCISAITILIIAPPPYSKSESINYVKGLISLLFIFTTFGFIFWPINLTFMIIVVVLAILGK